MRRLAIILVLAGCATAQVPPSPTFDVARVAPADPHARVICANLTYPGGRLRFENCTLKQFIHFAWDLPDGQIQGGPAWIASDGYTIEATPPSNSAAAHWNPNNPKLPPPSEELLMLRALLLDRFHLQVRDTSEERSVLALELHGDHHALASSTDASVFPVVLYGRVGLAGHPPDFLRGENATLAQFAARIGELLHQPVVDRTILPGSYNFTVEFALDPNQPGPALTTAIQDLGLRLVATKASVPGLTILSAEKPTVN